MSIVKIQFNWVAFGAGLRSIRMRRRKTQEEVALSAGIAQHALSTYEQGLRQPRIETLVVLADVLETTPGRLLKNLQQSS